MPERQATDGWDRYLAEYHDANPGITEDVLAGARDAEGRSPYDWLVETVPLGASTVVDLACGSGPVGRRLPSARVVGVDRSEAELTRARAAGPTGFLVRADGAALPLAGTSADAVVSSMALMLLRPLGAVLAEARRLLRPGGTFAATVPTRSASPGPAGPAFGEILGALGQTATDYPEPFDGSTLADRFSVSGLTLRQNDTGLFTRTVRHPEDAELIVRSFYAPGAGATRVAAAVAAFQRRVGSAPVRVGYRIRRLVALR